MDQFHSARWRGRVLQRPSFEVGAETPVSETKKVGRSSAAKFSRYKRRGMVDWMPPKKLTTQPHKESMSASSTSVSTESSRPSFARSKTMPAFRRTLSLSSMDKSLASLRKSSTKGLRQMSSFRKSTAPPRGPTAFLSPSTESIPVFTTPDYNQPPSSCPPPIPSISPLTRPGGAFKRVMTMPAPVRALVKLPGLKKTCKLPAPSRESSASTSAIASVSDYGSASSVSSKSTRRRSSIASVESFTSTEERVTVGLRLRALPSTVMGLFSSLICVILILVLPAMATAPPKRKPAPRSYEREIILTDEQERNPPRLPSSTFSSRVSRRLSKVFRRAASARRASNPREAFAAFFSPRPKRVHATKPVRVDPATLKSEVPLVVYSSPIALPFPKGPAPVVRPARPARRFTILPTLSEEGARLDEALCAGW
ncbi:hypothetical protein C8F04DRAFT_1237815 [Mycena alexandri]|uniref:Uncharacterized protein n=1 Tax=Mycena alexandri TaxID=1745969 RepID=A0AAD6SHA3_9AGAR|nr:hypothetical protein C8F04DRAFT_1237815 [Mycena alexandri]